MLLNVIGGIELADNGAFSVLNPFQQAFFF
jgi:hypothetical protein